MAMVAKIRRMFHREGLSIREIARKTGLARNTVARWLGERSMGQFGVGSCLLPSSLPRIE